MEKTTLVTGGAGFIRFHIVDEAVEIGAKVKILDNMIDGSRENIINHINTNNAD